jgi:hypothetical protein
MIEDEFLLYYLKKEISSFKDIEPNKLESLLAYIGLSVVKHKGKTSLDELDLKKIASILKS